MGCNFYLIKDDKHIGKRSAAGMYCWDCKQTLCARGEQGIHEHKSDWNDMCFSCGEAIPKESIEESSAGRELGFNKSKPKRKKGVASCSSFTWAIDPIEFFIRIDTIEHLLSPDIAIRDEYDHKYSFKGFCDIMTECPIQYYAVGEDFA